MCLSENRKYLYLHYFNGFFTDFYLQVMYICHIFNNIKI